MADANLVIRVLADTTAANASFSGMSNNLTKALGVGAAGGLAVGITEAAADVQSAMARVQVAMNNVDFAQGTAKYSAAKDSIMKDSVQLATSFDDVAAVYAQAARYLDNSGNKLPTDKLNEYTDTVVRLAKVSTDGLSGTDIGQQLDVLSKLNNTTDFSRIGNEVAELAQSHNQGEGVTFQTAIPLAQYGAQLGVTPEQQLGTATYLADRQAGGNQAGASIGRMFMRMDAAADNLLDPEVSSANARKSREAAEHLDDLQSSLAVAQQRQSQMYGQHGLKTAYKRDPAALMQSQNEIAKLQREIADAQSDAADMASSKPKPGTMDIKAMAKVAGVDATDYANAIKNDPMNALMQFTNAIGSLPAEQRGAALRGAGITNVRDLKTAEVLSSEPDVLARYIAEAGAAGNAGTALANQSGVILDTTKAKQTDVLNAAQGTAALVGEPARAELDKGLTALLDGIQKNGFGPLEEKMKVVTDSFGGLGATLAGLGPALMVLAPFAPAILGKGAAAAGGAASAASGAVGGASGLGGLLAGGLGGAAAGGIAWLQINQQMQGLDALNQARTERGLAPIQVNIGDIISQGGSPDEILAHVIAQLTTAWNTAMSSTPVTGAAGGAYHGSSVSPR